MNSLSTRSRSLLLVITVLLVFSVLAGCSSPSTSATGGKNITANDLPDEMKHASSSVQDAYVFAAAHPEIMKNIPCYCGCGKAGHTSNYDCYIKEVKADGTIVYDTHALGCSICVDITQQVMKMTREGKSLKDMRQSIDQTFSQYGPSNMPPAQ